MENTEAILLRRTRLTETSLVLSWLTLRNGRIKTVAKGALRPKSPLRGKLDLFYQCDISYAESRRSELHTLREAALIGTFPGIRKSYVHLATAGYFSELIEECTEPMVPLPELYDLLLRALHFLDTKEATPAAVRHFESELTRHLGLHDGLHRENSPDDILASHHPRTRRTRDNLWKYLSLDDFSPKL